MKIRQDRYSKTRHIAKTYRIIKRSANPTRREVEEIEAVEKALDWIKQAPCGESWEKALREMYVNGKTLTRAAMDTGYTPDGLKRPHRLFICKLAEYLGY